MMKESLPIHITNIINEQDKEKLKLALLNYDYNNIDENGHSILHFLSKDGNKELLFEVMDTLSNENRDEDVKILINAEDYKKWTPIYYAIDASESGFPEIVDFLLKHGANPNSQDIKGITPLHLAAYKGQDDNVEILLKHKSNSDIKDIVGRVPLNYAIMEGQTNAVQALIENNYTDLTTKDVYGDNLMHYAILCKGNALLYVIMLADKGININVQNNEGDTPLILCAKNGAKDNIRIIQKLLEINADSNVKNRKGDSFYSILSEEAEKEKFECNSSDEEEYLENKQEKNINKDLLDGIENKAHINLKKGENKKSMLMLFFYFVFPIILLISSMIII